VTEPLTIIVAAAAASLVTSAYHELAGRARARAARRAACRHTFGPTTEVAPPSAFGIGSRERFYKRFCERGCGEQLDVDKHGNPYVPRGRK
jgi:hypothetical protein